MIQNKKQGVKILSEFMGFSKPFNTSWDALMQVVDKLESLDLKDKIYSWEDSRGTNYNFQCVEVEISSSKCWVMINLELDPSIYLNQDWMSKQNSLEEEFTATKLESVFNSCVEAVEYLKEKKLI